MRRNYEAQGLTENGPVPAYKTARLPILAAVLLYLYMAAAALSSIS